MSVLILRGIPGSGKSTFANKWIKEDSNRARVNRDEIRMQVFGVEFGCDEDTITHIENGMIRSLVYKGYDIVVDDTNVKENFFRGLYYFCKRLPTQVEVKVFNVPLETALFRNSLRAKNGGRFVPEEVIISMHETLEKSADLLL